jgi:hypothetical protein
MPRCLGEVRIVGCLTSTGLFDQCGETEIGKRLFNKGSNLIFLKTAADMNCSSFEILAGSKCATRLNRDILRQDGGNRVEWWRLRPRSTDEKDRSPSGKCADNTNGSGPNA